MKILKMILVMFVLIYLQTNSVISQWVQVGLTTNRVMSLAAGPNGYVYAGTYSNGLYRSIDSGKVWTQVLGPSAVYEVFSIAFDSSGGLLAGTYAAGLYRSTTNGNSWTLLSSASGPNNLPVDDIYAITVGPTGSIFAADGASQVGEIYRSTDVGSTWQRVKAAGSNGFVALAASPSGNIYTGGGDWFYYSINSGDNWTWEGSSSGLTKAPLFLAAGSASLVFAGTSGGGVFRSMNNGVNWSAVNTNLTDSEIRALLLHDSTLYAGTYNSGVFVSYDKGSHWNAINNGLTDLRVYSLAVGDSCIYAGTYSHGVWKIPLSQTVTSVSSTINELPCQCYLEQNYPNPFNPSTTISFILRSKSFVSLKVFDIMGREVATIVSEKMSAGTYSRQWNAASFSSGVYFYRIQTGSYTETKKLVLLK